MTPFPSTVNTPAPPRRRDVVLIVILVAVVLALKWHYLWLLRVDSDEPQHLHVVWLWTRGLMPFRDAFDNHMPLFSWSMAPLLRWIGERPDAVLLMRVPMLLLWLLGLWPIASIARHCGGDRLVPLTLLLVMLETVLFVYSQQFRPDNLWALFWLTAMAGLVRAPKGWKNAVFTGLLAGAALATSMKTVVLLAALVAAAVAIVLVERRRRLPWAWMSGAALAALVLPLLVAVACWQAGLWDDFLHCVIGDNTGSHLHQKTLVMRFLLTLALLPLAMIVVLRAFRPRDPRTVAARIALLGAVWALIVFRVLWPSFTGQDELPVLPLVLVVLALWVERGTARGSDRFRALLWSLIGVSLLLLFGALHPWQEDAAAENTALRANVLALTGPDDFVLDAKGESVFRPRPVYPVFELLTLHKIRRGRLQLDLPRVLTERRVGVVLPQRVITDPEFADFLRANYLEVVPGLLLAGKQINIDADHASAAFDIAIAGDYQVDGCDADCRIDGAATRPPLHLTAGPHELTAHGPRQVDVLFASVARLPSYHTAIPTLEPPLCPNR